MKELRALTGLRAVAALWVVLYHLRDALPATFPATRPLAGLFQAGFRGVDLFFVLSGFILTLNYAEAFPRVTAAGYAAFLRKRLARIYPVHLFTLALLVGAYAVGASASSDPRTHGRLDLVLNLLLVHDWVDRPSWNFVSWSISAEWFAYLIFPFLVARICRVRTLGGVLGAALALGAMEVGYRLFFPGSGGTTAHGGLVRVSGEFLAGCFAAGVYRQRPPPERAAAFGAAALFCLLAAWAAQGARLWYPVALFPPLVFCLAGSSRGAARLLASRALVYGGRISYALYMTHAILLSRFEARFPLPRWSQAPLAQRLLLFAGLGAALWLAADLTWRLVEEPCRRRLSEARPEPKALPEAA